MRALTITQRMPLPSKDELALFEMNNDVMLPEEFKTFLLFQHPIYIKEMIYKTKNHSYVIEGFFTLTPNSSTTTLEKAYGNLKEYFYEQYLPFGYDGGGWLFVISLIKEDNGKVYFCRMDESIPDALTLLADSFGEFIDGLRPPMVDVCDIDPIYTQRTHNFRL